MALVTGPLMSLDARGSVAGTITFSNWKGRQYVRQLVIPANPNTATQQSTRGLMRFLSQQWSAMTTANKATWAARAAATSISPFNAFIAHNLARWTQFLSPGKQDPVPNTGTVQTTTTRTFTGQVGQVTMALTVTVVAQGWGVLIFRSPTGTFTTARSNAIAAVRADSVATFNFIDSGLLPGTYFYDTRLFTDAGVLGAEQGELSATVT